MNAFQVTFVIAIALIAHSCADYSAAPAPATAPSSSYDSYSPPPAAAADYGKAKEEIPYSSYNNQNTIITSSVTYPQNKSRVLVYYPASILIKRPPTNVVLRHPPTLVKPAPMVVHQPPPTIVKKVYLKKYPQSVQVTPLYVHVSKPQPSKYYVKENKPTYSYPTNDYSSSSYSAPAPADYSGSSYSAPADYSGASYAVPAEASYVPTGDSYTVGNTYTPSETYAAPGPAYQTNDAYAADIAPVPAPVDGGNSPAYAFANHDIAAARAGYELVQDAPAASALNLLGSGYQAQPTAY